LFGAAQIFEDLLLPLFDFEQDWCGEAEIILR